MTTNNSSLLADAAPARPIEHPDATRDRIAAEKLYPPAAQKVTSRAPNAEVQQVRDANAAVRGMYAPDKQFGKDGGAVRDLALALDFKASQERLDVLVSELASIAVDVGMDRHDVERLASIVATNGAKPPTDEMREAFQRTAIADARRQYGKEFDSVLSDAKALAQRDPRLAQILNKNGVGDDPHIIGRLCELGIAARARGQLAPKK